jgi:GntR family transcriptional regulator
VGDRLPKESILARQLGISRSTLRVALGYLETCGLISRRPSVGTFVAASIPSSTDGSYFTSLDRFETLLQIAERTDMNLRIIYRDVDQHRVTGEIASTLGVSEGTFVSRIQIVESIDDTPTAFLDTYISKDFIDKQSLSDYQGDVITYLSTFSEYAPSHTRSEIRAKNATEEIANKLELADGEAVLYLQETFHTRTGSCVAISRNYFVSDIFRFYIIRRLAQ